MFIAMCASADPGAETDSTARGSARLHHARSITSRRGLLRRICDGVGEVSTPYPVGEGRASLGVAKLQVMQQRVAARGCHVRVGRKIGRRVEADRRVASL